MLAFYADESGSFSISDPGQPWVVLLAIGFDDDRWTVIDDGLTALKRVYFPGRVAREVEIGSNDLRMARVRPGACNPFSSLEPEALRSFGNDLYALLDSLPFAWCASVVHKPTAVGVLSLSRADELFTFAYTQLVGILDAWCAAENEPGRLFMDQRSSDLHGKVHDRIVEVHDRFRKDERIPGRPQIIERPYFHDSARSNHIQIADIFAYNVLRRFRSGDPRYAYFERIQPKMWCSRTPGRRGGLVICAPGPENDETG